MNTEVSAAVGFAVAGATSMLLTPVAIAVARKTDFYDRPREYRQHAAPTPFLGGAAVLIAFLTAAVILGAVGGGLVVVLAGAVGMWLIGTVDDRVAVRPTWRVLVTGGAAIALYQAGLGWDTAGGTAVDIVLTVVWTVGLVNAFNLMDNLDGACGSVAAVAAAGVGMLAAIKGQASVAALAFALSGACAAFLRWNLAKPARIFLGDGGSMPIGFLVAALAMAAARHSAAGNAGLLVGALVAGLPILDVTLVSVSRTRRDVSVLTGGRDHLSHRLLLALHSPRRVAGVLAIGQGILCALAILGYELGTGTVAGLAFAAFATGAVAILVFDTATWRPGGIAVGGEPRGDDAPEVIPASADAG